jgi:5-carboxymethyl-2-hydroxymuconate isomerase
MPHLTLEHSDNIEFEAQPLLKRLHEELAATGAINLKGLKSRAIKRTEYRIADGYDGYAFVHLNILLKGGRDIETRQEIARRAMAVLEEAFGHYFDDGYISLSVDMKEMEPGLAITRHNIPPEGVPG